MFELIKRMWRAFCFYILPKKLFKKYFVDKHTYFRNPLYEHQKYKYRLCGCGSGNKVKWCCGKGKWVSHSQYDQLKLGLEMWEGRR